MTKTTGRSLTRGMIALAMLAIASLAVGHTTAMATAITHADPHTAAPNSLVHPIPNGPMIDVVQPNNNQNGSTGGATSGSTSNSPTDFGCAVANYSTSAITAIIQVLANATASGITIITKVAGDILMLGLVLWLVWQGISMLLGWAGDSNFQGKLTKTLLTALVAGAFLLVNPTSYATYYSQYIVGPMVGTGADIASSMIQNAGTSGTPSSCSITVSGPSSDPISNSVNFAQFIGQLTLNMSYGFQLASGMWNYASSISGVTKLLDIAYWGLSGFFLMISNFLVIMTMIIHFLFILFRLYVISVFSPVLALAIPFPIFRQAAKSIIMSMLNTSVTFIAWTIVAAIGGSLVQQVASWSSGPSAQTMQQVLQQLQNVSPTGTPLSNDALAAALNYYAVAGAGFWGLWISFLLIFFLINAASGIATMLVGGGDGLAAARMLSSQMISRGLGSVGLGAAGLAAIYKFRTMAGIKNQLGKLGQLGQGGAGGASQGTSGGAGAGGGPEGSPTP
jgi:hypothetical protein